MIDLNWIDNSYSIIEFFKTFEKTESLKIWTWNVGLQNDHFMTELTYEFRRWQKVCIVVGQSDEHLRAVADRFSFLPHIRCTKSRLSHRKIWLINNERIYVGSKNLAADGCTDIMVEVPYTLRNRIISPKKNQLSVVSLPKSTR